MRKSKLNELNFLLGNWTLESNASNSNGDASVQTGTMSWIFDMDSTVIRNQRNFKRTESSGAYSAWSKQSIFYEYILYNPSRSMFEFIPFEYGAAGAPRYWLVDTKKKVIQYRFARFDTGRKITLETIVTLKAISENELVETFEDIVFETGARDAINTIRLKRAQ